MDKKTISVSHEIREEIERLHYEEASLRESALQASIAAGERKRSLWDLIYKHHPEVIPGKSTLDVKTMKLTTENKIEGTDQLGGESNAGEN